MSIIVAGTVDVDPAQRDAALEAARGPMERTRAQKGCMDYNWSPDPLTPGRIYVFERWESQDDLAAHFKGPYYLEMRETIGRHGLAGADVSKYRIDLQEPVYDPTMTPRADFFTEGLS